MKFSSTKKCASFKHKNNFSNNNMFNLTLSHFPINYDNLNKTNYRKLCILHNKITEKFCLTCVKDICPNCFKNHNFHQIIKYRDIIPPSESEIKSLKRKILSYRDIFERLLLEIKFWKNTLEKKIKILENLVNHSKVFNFVFNYDANENNIKNIIIFKEIFRLIKKEETNIDGINDLYIIQYILSKNLLDNLLSNKSEFIKNGIEIIKYLSEININTDIDDINNNNIQSLERRITNLNKDKINNINRKYSTNTYIGYKRLIKNNEENNDSFSTYKSINSSKSNSLSNILYTKKIVNNRYKINNSYNKLNKSVIIETKNNFENNSLLKRKDLNINNNYSSTYSNEKEIKYFTHKKYIIESPSIKYSSYTINNVKNIDNYSNQKITRKKPKLFLNKLEISPIKPIKKYTNNNKINNFTLLLPEEDKDKENNIRLIKTTPEKIFKINPNKPVCIGHNLDNSSCQLSLINQNNNDIQIISFKKDIYNIPTLIYLDEKNEEIKIGEDAEILRKENPHQIIFDIIKLYGKNYDDIFKENRIYPFYLSKESNGRIYIKINYNGKKDIKFYIENVLILYLEHLFKKLFSKIIIEENNNNNKNIQNNILDVNICVTIPYYISYIKRKILEKIFQKHIFQNLYITYNNINSDINNNSIYSLSLSSSKHSTISTINFNNFNNSKKSRNIKSIGIKLNNIKIINSPNCSILCLQNNNNENEKNESISSSLSFSFKSCSKENNILILYISNDSTNISINSINNQMIENNIKDKDKCQYIKKYQVKNITNLNYGEEKLIFEKNYNNDLFNKIILEIRNIIMKSKISELNIDDIILIGNISKCHYMKKKLSEIFINNNIIYNKLNNFNFENDDFYLVSGAAIESTNYNKINNYIFKNICPISFGIENINGKIDLIIKKGEEMPFSERNFVKMYKKKNYNFVEVKIYEINEENNKMILYKNKLNCENMKLFNNYNKIENDFIELLFEFEIDDNFNLSVYILDRKTFKKRFELAINVDVIKEQ